MDLHDLAKGHKAYNRQFTGSDAELARINADIARARDAFDRALADLGTGTGAWEARHDHG